MTRIAFAGSGHGGIAALISLQKKFKIIEVISNDVDILKLLRVNDTTPPTMESCKSSIIICAGYHKIVSKNLLKTKTLINTHPSLLPKYRGMHGLVWAMLNFEKEVGFSIHLMNELIDDGDILAQYKIQYVNQTSQEIMAKFDAYVEKTLGETVLDFINKKITPIKQDKSKATWCTKRNINDCILDFNQTNKYIGQFFKALVYPYPLPMLKVNDELYEIEDYCIFNQKYNMHLGQVINIEDISAFIKLKEGILVVKKLRHFSTKESIQPSKLLRIGQRLL